MSNGTSDAGEGPRNLSFLRNIRNAGRAPPANLTPAYKTACSVADLFDSHDDRDDDGEAGSVEEHKSVIMHLLSQVRLGMDLTKVGTKSVLPSNSSRLHRVHMGG